MLGDWACRVCLQLFGYVYPAYKTFKVVQMPATRSNDTLLRHWCQYWTLMAVFTAVQPVLDTFVFWVPLYYELKLAFAIYLWSNDLAGAQHVWGRWFQPYVTRYEPLVDSRLAESKALAGEWLHSNTMRLVALAQEKVLSWLAQLQAQAQQAAGGAAAAAAAPAADGAQRRRTARGGDGAKRRGSGGASGSGGGSKHAHAEVDEYDFSGDEGTAGAPPPGKAEPAVPPPLKARFSGFSLHSFYSARSADLQEQDVGRAGSGLKTYPVVYGKDE